MHDIGKSLRKLRYEFDGCAPSERGFIGRLKDAKSLPVVREYLVSWAERKKVSVDDALNALVWWLSPRCEECHGTGWSGANTGKGICKPCHGKGLRLLDGGEGGRKTLDHIDSCLYSPR